MVTGSDEDRLETWQQIAGHLKVAVRTAQIWAKNDGLPVHRLQGARTPVFAWRSELDAWVRSRVIPVAAKSPETPVANPPRPPAWRRPPLIIAAIALSTVVLVAAALRFNSHPVALLRADESILIAEDAAGRELWRRNFERGLDPGRYAPHTIGATYWLGDLDHDGRQQVLFYYDSAAKVRESSTFFSFNQSGAERWRFQVGHAVRDTVGEIYPPFHVTTFLTVPAQGNTTLVAVASGHPTDQACQLALLDGRSGRLLAEYWHPGGLFFLRNLPRGPAGKPLLLAAGVNNGEHRATIVALDPSALKGPSTPSNMRDQKFRLLDMPQAHEELVILFPRTCLSRDEPYTRIEVFEVDDHVVRANVIESYSVASRRVVHYEFDHSLRLRRAFLSSNYREEHLAKEQSGGLNHSWQQDEKALAQGLEYRRN